ncbi:hypothetical protein [uncultured Allobaculum sp.]|uniref:hypothetical protein n=1 Tax=uncultured Allobaculum sp. TaxID=1187017 RepID=UPI00258D89D5|nr:hypothetical protein [uncultured Allobaculum sp.]
MNKLLSSLAALSLGMGSLMTPVYAAEDSPQAVRRTPAKEEDADNDFELLNEGDKYLRTGDKLKLEFTKTYYKGVPVEYDVTWVNRPGVIEVDADGVLHVEKAGNYYMYYGLEYSKETRERFKNDELPALVDMNFFMNFVVSDTSRQPVYRLYDPNAGDHHFTKDKKEYDALGKLGWTQEGSAWYCSPETDTPVYRQYNPNAQAGRHNLTSNTKEKEYLISVGWKDAGIVWYTPVIAYSDIDLDWLEETPPMAHN